MAIYQFDTPQSRFAGSIAQLIASSGDPQARAAEQAAAAQARATEVRGQAWGNAIQQAGQIPTQVIQQQAAARSQALRDSLLKGEVEDRAAMTAQRNRAQQGQQLLARLSQQYGDDSDAIAKGLTDGGFGDAAQTFLHGATQTAEDRAKLKSLKTQQDATLAGAVGRAANSSASADDFMSKLDHFVLGGQIDAPTRQKFVDSLQQAGPDGFDAWKQRTVQWADSVVAPTKLTKDEKLVTGVSGTPISDNTDPLEGAYTINGQRFKRDGTPIGPVVPPQTPKAPPSLEEQYLTAVSKGDTAGAAAIRTTWEDKAKASRDPVAAAQLAAIRNLSQQEAQARLDEKDVTSSKNQQKFEQEYRTVLQRGLSSRSGGLGAEDAKVQQANHLTSLMDQFYDPKTGDYNIPRVQLNELALGLARLTAPGGTAGVQMLKEFEQRTAKGDIAGALTYLTGSPIAANTQAITQMLRDSILRQGQTAQDNREGEMRYLRGLAPTDLAEERRTALEANSLNPLRQSKVLTNDKGERKLVVSIDGGKTWR